MTKKKVMILGGSEKKKTWEGLEKVKRRDKVIKFLKIEKIGYIAEFK